MCQNVKACTENWCSGVIKTYLWPSVVKGMCDWILAIQILLSHTSVPCLLQWQGRVFNTFHAPDWLPRFLPKQKVFWYKTAVISGLDLSLEQWELIILNFTGTSVNTLTCQNKCPAFLNLEILHCFCLPVSWIPYASLHTAYKHFPSVFSKEVVFAANFIWSSLASCVKGDFFFW